MRAICLFTCLFMMGCDDGIQLGRSVVSSSTGISLVGQSGTMLLLHGNELPDRDEEVIVFGVVLVDPNHLTNSEGATTKHTRTISELELAEYRSSGAKIACTWNRQTNEVRFGETSQTMLPRHVFVVVVDPNGELVVHQAKVPVARPTPEQVLDSVRTIHPDLFKNVSIQERNVR